mmetsp:Transcript_27222/g.35295  ORF Transcript_27222/g.35295 Transcript_27222/m.35295 type:complete len:490 (-) Transcript_27222:186-1655(-)
MAEKGSKEDELDMEKPVMIRGKYLRDEFACPITRELMKDPVIAGDGHTYDRTAIERWLKNHNTSPKTGEQMQNFLIPNHNLKRLLQDMIREGGEGLYLPGDSDTDDDLENSAQYQEENNINGELESNSQPKEQDPKQKQIEKKKVKQKEAKGKYRFALVQEYLLELKCLGPNESDWNGKSFRVCQNGAVGGRKQPGISEMAQMDFIQFSDATVSRRHFEIFFDKKARKFFIRDLGSAGGTFLRIPYGVPLVLQPGSMFMLGKHQLVVRAASGDEGDFAQAKIDSPDQEDGNHSIGAVLNDFRRTKTSVTASEKEGESGDDENPVHLPCAFKEMLDSSKEEKSATQGHTSIVLECFAPEGTPIQGKTYHIGPDGATLGRKQTNTISFSHEVKDSVMGIDSSISGEHARIEFDGNQFYLLDGTREKASTNGTWLRLSPMHECSRPFPFDDRTEILIGTFVRFQATINKVIVEKDANEIEDIDNDAESDIEA